MLKKVLIANRGEIVNRIIATCQKMGIGTVVVYSAADREMPYLERADEAVLIGPANPVHVVLRVQRHVVVDDMGEDVEVEAPCGHVRGDQQLCLT